MVTKDEYYQIKAYFDIGLSLSAIAKRLNLHSKTVSKILTGGFKCQRQSKSAPHRRSKNAPVS